MENGGRFPLLWLVLYELIPLWCFPFTNPDFSPIPQRARDGFASKAGDKSELRISHQSCWRLIPLYYRTRVDRVDYSSGASVSNSVIRFLISPRALSKYSACP